MFECRVQPGSSREGASGGQGGRGKAYWNGGRRVHHSSHSWFRLLCSRQSLVSLACRGAVGEAAVTVGEAAGPRHRGAAGGGCGVNSKFELADSNRDRRPPAAAAVGGGGEATAPRRAEPSSATARRGSIRIKPAERRGAVGCGGRLSCVPVPPWTHAQERSSFFLSVSLVGQFVGGDTCWQAFHVDTVRQASTLEMWCVPSDWLCFQTSSLRAI